jgi:RNA-directed DNA polymerase
MSLFLSSEPPELRERFFALQTREDVARLLEIEDKRLVYYLYILPPREQYRLFEIQKKSGAPRQIAAPITPLRIIQRKLNQVLQSVYRPGAAVFGFVQEKGIKGNAERHIDRNYVLNIDIQDFFPSINFGRVYGLFLAKPYQRTRAVATVLAQICTLNNALPQGAPTSPIISNMICARLDSRLMRLARDNRCFYTRYADDLTFSTTMPSFPHDLARVVKDISGTHVQVGAQLEQVINENGFTINYEKVRLQTRGQRQAVTGVTVNEKSNLPRAYIREIRAMLHAWEEYGEARAEDYFRQKYDLKNRNPYNAGPRFRDVLKGKIEFLGLIRGKDDTYYCKYRKRLRQLAPEMVKGPPCDEDSPGLSEGLYHRVRKLLCDTEQFQSHRTLAPLFGDPALSSWRTGLPDTSGYSPDERTEQVLDYLHTKRDREGTPALTLLIRCLTERTDPGDMRYHQLAQLENDLSREL